MDHLVRSIDLSLRTGNAYAALTAALTLPDICGWILDPSALTKARYTKWFDKYVSHYYNHMAPGLDPGRVQYLSGDDCYALRCAFLHEGRDDITGQRARQALKGFDFMASPAGTIIHCNLYSADDTLQLDVEIFCGQFIEATERFRADIACDTGAIDRMSSLLRVRQVASSPFATRSIHFGMSGLS